MSSAELALPDRACFLDLGRTTLRLWEWGDPSDPPVVLVHGGWDHGRMFDELAPAVAALGHHAVAVDLRGHGDSGRLGFSGNCWVAWNLDLALVIRHLGAPAGLIGHSLGGGQVLSVASAFPELVDWVLSIDGLGPAPEMMIVEDHAAQAAQWLADAEKVWRGPQREYESVEALAARRLAINTRLPERWAVHLACYGSTRGPGGGLIWKSDPVMRIGGPGPFGEHTLRGQYRAIRCPVTVMTGTEPDQWSDLSDDVIAGRVAAMADVAHVRVPEAGHYVHLEQPAAVIAEVPRLLARAEPRRPPATGVRSPGRIIEHASERAPGALRSRSELGRSGPSLVVLHDTGTSDASAGWQALLKSWPGPSLAPDLPGHGASDPPPGAKYTPADVTLAAIAAIEQTGFPPRPDVVVGHGWGAFGAELLAAAGRAGSLVIVDGLGPAWSDFDGLADSNAAWLRAMLDDPELTRWPVDRPDPVLAHGFPSVWERTFTASRRQAISVPVLALESPRSPTPPAARAERIAAFGGPGRLAEIAAATPDLVLEAVRVAGWADP
jgi:pimeloyl-ACP methyl ester carboxylesterase